jgi:methyl-accepting chemotaxis protein
MRQENSGALALIKETGQQSSGKAFLLAETAQSLSGLGRGAANIAGSADDLGVLTDKAVQVFADVQTSLGGIIAANRQIADRAMTGVSKAEKTHSSVRDALGRAEGLADAVQRVEVGISEVSGTLRQVAEASDVINKIAFQTRIVAFNASVEAVRAGDAGRGFGVVAQAVKDLAQQVGASSRQIATVIDELTERVKELERQIQQDDGGDGSSDAKSIVTQAIESFESNFGEVENLMRETADRSRENLSLCDHSVETLRTFGGEFARSVEIIRNVRSESCQLLEMSEEAIEKFAHSGVQTEDTPYIEAAVDTAQRIGARFEEALAQGEITLAALFDERYQKVQGSNPQQFVNAFVSFTDAVLPEIQEPILDFSPLVTFCAAVDRNAYLPTHNLKFSQPQGRDPVVNAATSRNRRIFNDRTGLRAAKNKATFLLQTYRREMSAGQYVLMKDVSAPIWVAGRHWGALRIGYRFAD